MPALKKEIKMLEMFSGSHVVALALNDENMSQTEVMHAAQDYEAEFKIPVIVASKEGMERLVKVVETLRP